MVILVNESTIAAHTSQCVGIVESTVHKCSQIATLPAVAIQIIRLCEDPRVTLEELNKLVTSDPVLGVRVLKLVNSAYYGMPGQISSIKHAILLLGLRAVKNVAVAASLVKLMRRGQIGRRFNARHLWTHSIAVATCAQMLADQTTDISPDEAFLAGLIHDIGIVVEMQSFRTKFTEMMTTLDAEPALKFREAEENVFGASHETFGAGLCQAWKLPANLQFSTGFHHRPWELSQELRRLPSIIHIADILAARNKLGYTRTVETGSIDPLILSTLNLTNSQVNRISRNLPAALCESQQLLADNV